MAREIARDNAGGICERCGKVGNQPHHVIGRSNHALRWDMSNLVWLCSGCHTMNAHSAHVDPIGFLEWFKKVRPYDYEYLLVKKNEIWDKDYSKVLQYLEGVR